MIISKSKNITSISLNPNHFFLSPTITSRVPGKNFCIKQNIPIHIPTQTKGDMKSLKLITYQVSPLGIIFVVIVITYFKIKGCRA